MTACYGIITDTVNAVTTVVRDIVFSPPFRTVRPAARRYSRRRVPSGSRAVHWDRSPVCAAAARPGHQCSDRKYLREFGSPATNAPATAAAEVPRERPATTRTRPCSARSGQRWGRAACGRADQAASHRPCTRLAPDHGLVRPAPFPAAATRRGRGPATPAG